MNPADKHKPVIGLAGGIGSGKSLVAGQLRALACAVIDADELARSVMAEPDVSAQLIQWWGPAIQDANGHIDRQAVARIVFEDPTQLRRLEQLTHPKVHAQRSALHHQYQADPKITAIVEDCPLLLETGLDSECDVVIFIASPHGLRLQRLAAHRGWTEQDLANREKNQLPLDKKAQRADYVIVNDASEAACEAHVRGVFSQILKV